MTFDHFHLGKHLNMSKVFLFFILSPCFYMPAMLRTAIITTKMQYMMKI